MTHNICEMRRKYWIQYWPDYNITVIQDCLVSGESCLVTHHNMKDLDVCFEYKVVTIPTHVLYIAVAAYS